MRMIMGAERMCMPSPTVEQFVDAVKATVLANKRWVSCKWNIGTPLFFSPIDSTSGIIKVYTSHFRFLLQGKVPSISDHC